MISRWNNCTSVLNPAGKDFINNIFWLRSDSASSILRSLVRSHLPVSLRWTSTILAIRNGLLMYAVVRDWIRSKWFPVFPHVIIAIKECSIPNKTSQFVYETGSDVKLKFLYCWRRSIESAWVWGEVKFLTFTCTPIIEQRLAEFQAFGKLIDGILKTFTQLMTSTPGFHFWILQSDQSVAQFFCRRFSPSLMEIVDQTKKSSSPIFLETIVHYIGSAALGQNHQDLFTEAMPSAIRFAYQLRLACTGRALALLPSDHL